MRTLDRYILKNFFVPFLYCFLGFIAIWLAFDLAEKTNDLVTKKISPAVLLYFYGTQVPQYVVIILPVALLLALLYSLSKMSRSNEIISMLASGMSLYRLVTPLILAGVAVSGFCFAMNYQLAPHADISKDTILEAPGDLQKQAQDLLALQAGIAKQTAQTNTPQQSATLVQEQAALQQKTQDLQQEATADFPTAAKVLSAAVNNMQQAAAAMNNAGQSGQAQAEQQQAMQNLTTAGQQKRYFHTSLLFRNRADSRTWMLQLYTDVFSPFVRAARPNLADVKSAEITQQDKDGNILRNYYTHEISFDPADNTWTLSKGKTVSFNHDDWTDFTSETWDTLKIKDWSETPSRIYSTDLDPAKLSLSELHDYLRFNADFPESQLAAYRTYYDRQGAVPAGCIVIVFIAAPLGIVYSRRGVLAGVAGSIFIFFGIMFFDKLFLALGKHGSIPPLFAAWGTDIIFGTIGLALLYVRAGNRDLFKFHPKNLLHLFKQA